MRYKVDTHQKKKNHRITLGGYKLLRRGWVNVFTIGGMDVVFASDAADVRRRGDLYITVEASLVCFVKLSDTHKTQIFICEE